MALLKRCFAITEVVVPQPDELVGVAQPADIFEPLVKGSPPSPQCLGVVRCEVFCLNESKVGRAADGSQHGAERRQAPTGEDVSLNEIDRVEILLVSLFG